VGGVEFGVASFIDGVLCMLWPVGRTVVLVELLFRVKLLAEYLLNIRE
jgi:hypothetical protein